MDVTWQTERMQAEKAKDAKDERTRLAGVVEGLARTDSGLLFLAWIMQAAGTLAADWPQDAAAMAYREGARTVGLQLLSLCREAGCVDAVLQAGGED